ncbi:MAG: class IV adenylate cyclase [Bacteroidota bacterium]
MQEIEVKILEIDREAIEQKLVALGAEQIFDGELWALFFDHPDGQIKAKGDVLRLRREGETCILTYKQHVSKGEAKIMEETETVVENMETTMQILQKVGLQILKSTRKRRTSYQLPDGQVVIDDYADALAPIPVFLEVESPDMDALRRVVQALGYTMDDCNNWNTRDLIKHYL